MVIIKENVERIINEKDYPLYQKQGYTSLDDKDNNPKKQGEVGQKSLKKMTVPELKTIAEEKGIENTESLTKPELLKALEEK